jgi:hypothetical protein
MDKLGIMYPWNPDIYSEAMSHFPLPENPPVPLPTMKMDETQTDLGRGERGIGKGNNDYVGEGASGLVCFLQLFCRFILEFEYTVQ